eukprot:435067-Alexandrium_andersonii.AAC.1
MPEAYVTSDGYGTDLRDPHEHELAGHGQDSGCEATQLPASPQQDDGATRILEHLSHAASGSAGCGGNAFLGNELGGTSSDEELREASIALERRQREH